MSFESELEQFSGKTKAVLIVISSLAILAVVIYLGLYGDPEGLSQMVR